MQPSISNLIWKELCSTYTGISTPCNLQNERLKAAIKSGSLEILTATLQSLKTEMAATRSQILAWLETLNLTPKEERIRTTFQENMMRNFQNNLGLAQIWAVTAPYVNDSIKVKMIGLLNTEGAETATLSMLPEWSEYIQAALKTH